MPTILIDADGCPVVDLPVEKITEAVQAVKNSGLIG